MRNSYSGFLRYSLIDRTNKYNTLSKEYINEYNKLLKSLIPNKRTFKKYGVNFITAPTTLDDNGEAVVAVTRLFEMTEDFISNYRFIYKLALVRYTNEYGGYDDKIKVYGVLK